MPFVVKADVYYDVTLVIPAHPLPEESRWMASEVAAFLNALPREEMEACWRHRYRLHASREGPPESRTEEVPSDADRAVRWTRMLKAADTFGWFQMMRLDLHWQGVPWLDLWIGFEEGQPPQRFRASMEDWHVGRPGLERYR